jgi:hypothetical protein
MPTSLNHQPEVHHPKSPAIRWAADYPIYAPKAEVGCQNTIRGYGPFPPHATQHYDR